MEEKRREEGFFPVAPAKFLFVSIKIVGSI
jgi:hypothetical protein